MNLHSVHQILVFTNIIKQNNNNLIFLDFEYFGWDDPLKLISDFFSTQVMIF